MKDQMIEFIVSKVVPSQKKESRGLSYSEKSIVTRPVDVKSEPERDIGSLSSISIYYFSSSFALLVQFQSNSNLKVDSTACYVPVSSSLKDSIYSSISSGSLLSSWLSPVYYPSSSSIVSYTKYKDSKVKDAIFSRESQNVRRIYSFTD